MKNKWKWAGGIFAVLLALDIASKYYVHTYIPKMSWLYPFYPYRGIGVFKNFFNISFSINYVENRGAAWGILANYPQALFYARIVITIFLVVYLIGFNRDPRKVFPFILIITGALGNILDFIFYGYVIDMFYFKFGNYSYPLFNLADTMITIGMIWLIAVMFFKRRKK